MLLWLKVAEAEAREGRRERHTPAEFGNFGRHLICSKNSLLQYDGSPMSLPEYHRSLGWDSLLLCLGREVERERESLNLVGPRSGPAWSAWPLLLISNGGEDLFLGDDVI